MLRRRTFLLGASGLALGSVTEPFSGGAMLLTGSDPVGRARAWLEHLVWLQGVGTPATRVYDGLLHHAGDIDDAIRRRPVAIERDLQTVRAHTLGLAGAVAWADLGAHERAERNLRRAMTAAQQCSDHRLRAWVLRRMAHRRLYAPGDPEANRMEALSLLGTALERSDRNPAVMADVLVTRAEVYAGLRNHRHAMHELDRAASAAMLIERREVPGWLSGNLSLGRVESMRGACWLRLGRPDSAVGALERALGSGTNAAHSVILKSDLARAYATASRPDPERAADLLVEAAPVARESASALRRDRMRHARTMLTPWEREPFVRALDGLLAD